MLYICPSRYCRFVSTTPGWCPRAGDYRFHHDSPRSELVQYARADGGGQRCFVCMAVNDGSVAFVPLNDQKLAEQARFGGSGTHLCPEHADINERLRAVRASSGQD